MELSTSAAATDICMPSSRTIGLLLLACFAAARGNGGSWIEQYATESGAANQACDAKDYPACRQHLTTLLELLNGRADIVYRLAKVEAALGNRAAALDWLTTFSKMALPLAHSDTEPAFSDLQ